MHEKVYDETHNTFSSFNINLPENRYNLDFEVKFQCKDERWKGTLMIQKENQITEEKQIESIKVSPRRKGIICVFRYSIESENFSRLNLSITPKNKHSEKVDELLESRLKIYLKR